MVKKSDKQQTMTLKVNKLRAINKAQIDLNGITVISGENGSGKSTLSRILYNTIKFSKKYDQLVRKNLNKELREITSALSNLVQEVARYEEDLAVKNNIYSSRNYRRLSLRSSDIESMKEYENRLYSYIEIVKRYVTNLIGENQLEFEEFNNEIISNKRISSTNKRMRINRISRILQNAINENDKPDEFDFIKALSLFNSKISLAFETAHDFMNSRPIEIFSNELESLFHQQLKKKFNLIEFGLPITDWAKNRFNNTNWIKNSYYIDTPMAISDDYFSDSYWDELNIQLKENDSLYLDSFEEIQSVISGEVYYENNVINEGFKYKRSDGSVFNIEDCATGIKAFGIIQLLLNNGKLGKDTLLIIDEPEAHLHPQWIVEYARIVILLNKRLGVKFFIASHNPDMVSAIKYIAEKEEVDSGLNFYLAEKLANAYCYNYKSLKTEIEDIFSSFNIAIERINQYGVGDD